MDCKITPEENLENYKSLRQVFLSNRIPGSGSINLTQRCNLNCVHCYLGSPDSELRSQENELHTEQWLTIIDQLTEVGCLNLLLTGGEVLLRPDFEVIYEKAVKNGILVTVYTNGVLINDRILSLFADLPPQMVEISLYGATASTYESVTRVKGSFAKCIAGIKGLFQKSIKFKLKTMILAQNSHELEDIKKLANEFQVDFLMDPAISACLDGNKGPLAHRVDVAKAVKADFADPSMAKRWMEYFETTENEPESEFLYRCGAGLTHFHINPSGFLLPCMMLTKPAYDLTKGDFKKGWLNEIYSLRKIKADPQFRCNRCEIEKICSSCPAFFELENGSPEAPSQYLCDLAEKRFEHVKKHLQSIEKPLT